LQEALDSGFSGCGKGGTKGEFPEKSPSGAKARIDSVGFMRGLKPPPPSESSRSAAPVKLNMILLLLRHD
jgi:hypothetical protein